MLKSLKELQLFNRKFPHNDVDTFKERDYLLKPDVNPFIVYVLLKEYFGAPNCVDIDEDKQQWAWEFSYNNFYIEIYDWRLLSTSVAVYHINSDKIESQTLAETINLLLTKEGQQKKSKLKNLIKTCKHKVLENPFMKLLHLTGQEVKIKYNTLTSCHEEEKHMTRSSS